MTRKLIDIGANLTDPMFRGVYCSSQKHPDDLEFVLKRAWNQGIQRMIITVGTLNESDSALNMAKADERLFVTMGCHPTRCGEFALNPAAYYRALQEKVESNRDKVVAIGECGLDYDRLHFCDRQTQLDYFERQLALAVEFRLPLFLHCRNAHSDFFNILERNLDLLNKCGGGVVHSFDGTLDQAQKLLALSDRLFVGLNGCSLKTAENLAVIKQLPSERLLLETDSPWCGVRPSHAGYKLVQTKFVTVKKKEKWSAESLIDGRNEPCQIIQVLEVIAATKEQTVDFLSEIFYRNTIDLFFKNKQ